MRGFVSTIDIRRHYLVLVIFGVEYCINMGGPEIEGYLEWLKQHNFESPLYVDDDI